MIRKLSAILIFCLCSCTSMNEMRLQEALDSSEVLFQEKRYSEAMTVCSEAEGLARRLGDQFSLGKIYRTMAHISNATSASMSFAFSNAFCRDRRYRREAFS